MQGPELKQLDPEQVKITVSIRLPLWYRNHLAVLAGQRLTSLNQLMVEAIEKEFPPDE